MKADLISVHRFLSMPDGVFIIPIYQRHYSWTDVQCKQLWADIMAVVNGEHPSHFIGSVVCQDDPQIRRGTVIIDGQQRVTTLMILLRALRDSTDDEHLRTTITSNYLLNMNARDNKTRLRLKPVAKDAGAFTKLMNVERDVVPEDFTAEEQEGNAYKNYLLFRSLARQTLRSGAVTVDDIERVVEDLEVIEIRLQGENAQVVFESLNSRGLTLTPVDLIRNYILMAMPYGEQERLYKAYWQPIEEAVGSKRLQDFMLQWIIARRRSDNLNLNGRSAKLTKRTMYVGYKAFFEDLCTELGGIDECLSDILAYAKVYGHVFDAIGDGMGDGSRVDRLCIDIIDRIGTPGATCLVMYLVRRCNEGDWSERDLVGMLEALASYCTRQIACGARGSMDAQAASRVIKQMSLWDRETDKPALTTFWNVITSFVGGDAFPSTTAFSAALARVDMYQLRGSFARYLLYSLEQHGPNAKEIPLDDKTITVEHVMPQTLSEAWETYLDEHDDQESYEGHLHMLGNLCLTGYNSEMSNKLFSDKKPHYETSSFFYTQEIAKQREWTSVEIEARTSELARRACRIWALPAAYDVGNRVVPDKMYPLDTDPMAFRGMRPNGMTFMGKARRVGTWIEFLVRCLALCHDLDEDVFTAFVRKQSTGGAVWISVTPSELQNPKKIPGTPYYAGFGVDSARILIRTQDLAREYREDIGVDLLTEIQVSVRNPLISRR